MAGEVHDRSLGELFAALAMGIRTLIAQEAQLARTELKEKASQAIRGLIFLVAGAVLAHAALLVLVASLVLVLFAIGLPPWAAALVGAVLIAGGAYLLVRRGLAALQPQTLIPRETIASIKEDVRWLKKQTT